jgi:hypothetical protein
LVPLLDDELYARVLEGMALRRPRAADEVSLLEDVEPEVYRRFLDGA